MDTSICSGSTEEGTDSAGGTRGPQQFGEADAPVLEHEGCLRETQSLLQVHEHAARLSEGNTEPLGYIRSLYAGKGLLWYEPLGIGYIPSGSREQYDEAYFQDYQSRGKSPIAEELNEARLGQVLRHYTQEGLIDVGVGAGDFLNAARKAGFHWKGFDVNPSGVELLKKENRFLDPYEGLVEAITAWDVLEHIEEMELLLQHATHLVFTSMPIYRDLDHCLVSKHLKPGEHVWYFTEKGLEYVMTYHGFKLVEKDDVESRLGREDVLSLTFKRD